MSSFAIPNGTTGSIVSPPTPVFSIDELNDACCDLVQKAASHLATRRQIGGSFQGALIMSQAIYQALSIQDAIQHYKQKQMPTGE